MIEQCIVAEDGKFQDLFENAPVAYHELDRDGVIRRVNRTECELLGYQAGDMLGRPIWDFVPEGARCASRQAFGRKLSGEQPLETVQRRYIRRDGGELWLELHDTLVRNASGETIGIRSALLDVTERKRAETYRETDRQILQILSQPGDLRDAIQRMLGLLKTLTGCDALGIRLQDGEDFPYFVQDGYADGFLLTENSLVERAADGSPVRGEDGRVRLECTCGLVISGAADPANPLFTKGGSCWTNNSSTLLDIPPGEDPRLHPRNRCVHLGYVSVALIPIRCQDRIVGLIHLGDRRNGRFTLDTVELLEGIASHIGEALLRKRAEEALRESEERYRSLFENNHAAMLIVDPDGGLIVDANPAACRFYGWTREELRHAPLSRINALPAEELQAAMNRARTGSSHHFFFPHRLADGSLRDVEVFTGPVIFGGRQLLHTIVHDVTERRRAEAALRQANEAIARAERHYRDIFNSVLDAVFVSTLGGDGLPGRFLEVNDSACRYSGYTREELLEMGPLDLACPEWQENIPNLTQELLAKGQALYEGIGVARDGRRIPVEVITHLVDPAGSRTVISSVRDISERKRAEEEGRLARQLLALHVEQTPLAVIQFDPQGRVRAWNPGAVATFGFSPEEAIGQHWTFLVPESARGAVDGVWEGLRSCRGGHRSTNENITRDGRTICCEWFNTALVDPAGKTVGVASLAMDVTERNQAERKLRASEARLREAERLAHIGSSSWEVESDTTIWSEGLYRMTGRDPGGPAPGHAKRAELYTPESWARLEPAIKRILATGDPFEMDLDIVRPDGALRRTHGMVSAKRDRTGRVVRLYGSLQDITERKQAEEEKARLEAQFQQAQKMESVGRLAGGVAHDFNNLLTVINGYSQMLVSGLREGDPLREALSEIHHAGERAAGLTRQLLAFSRKQILDLRRLNVNRVVEEIRPMLERLMGDDVEVRVALQAEGGTVYADRHQLEQVVMNLAVNSRDAMPGGGKLLIETGRVERDESYARSHADARAGRFVMLAVSDTGVGMDQETAQRIFEPFFTTKAVGAGTGLGLSMVQGIVVQSGGHINIYSEPGQGTSFRIYLPELAGPEEDAGAQPPANPVAGGKETVLVVEDRAEVRHYAVKVLNSYGYRVFAAENAGQALPLCERERMDLVLTDVVMPNVSGRELAERLKILQPGIKVLFMSGYTDNAVEQLQVLRAGAEFIQKPFSPEQLAGKVRGVLGPPARAAAARVLVADDEPLVRGFLRKALEKGGYLVIEAEDGKQALEKARAGDVDVVITDLIMPEQEGIETIQMLRREVPGVGIIAISGGFGGQFLKVAQCMGADEVLIKPVSPGLLLAKVAEVLKSR